MGKTEPVNLVHTLTQREEETDSVSSGTIVYAPSSFVNSCMKMLLIVTIRSNVEIYQPVGFFTGSLKQQTGAFSTGRKTSLHFSKQINKANNEKRQEKVKNKKSN